VLADALRAVGNVRPDAARALLGLALALLAAGQAGAVLAAAERWARGADPSLVRHFVFGALDVATPPYSAEFAASLIRRAAAFHARLACICCDTSGALAPTLPDPNLGVCCAGHRRARPTAPTAPPRSSGARPASWLVSHVLIKLKTLKCSCLAFLRLSCVGAPLGSRARWRLPS